MAWKRRFRAWRLVGNRQRQWVLAQSTGHAYTLLETGRRLFNRISESTYADHTGLSAFGTSMLRPSGKQGNELLLAERPVLLAERPADQRRQRRPMPCCSSPLPSPVHKGRSSPTKRDAAPRVRSALHRRRPRALFFSSANARTTGRLLRASSYFPLYAASRAAKQDLTIFNAMPFA